MNFLAPLFLVGGLAVALPVVFHLIRRTSRVRTRFSSLMFLRPAPPRMTRRNRLEDMLLLCLRCAVIGLLALGFSRPFWKTSEGSPAAPAPARRVIALLDVSASMRRSGLWEQAQTRLQHWVDELGPGDELAVWIFGRQVRPVFDFADWVGLSQDDRSGWVRSRLAGVAPGWSSTHLDQALIEAGEALALPGEEMPLSRRQVVVVSDLQEGSRLADLQGYDWPEDVEVVLEPLTVRDHNNAGIQQLAAAHASVGGVGASVQVRVRVENAADSDLEQFQVGWTRVEDRAWIGSEMQVYVPAGQSRVVSVPAAPMDSGASVLRLQGDAEPFDNNLFLAATEPRHVRILYLGGEASTNVARPRFFLERAFRDTPLRRLTVTSVDGAVEDVAEALRDVVLVVATGRLSDAAGEALRNWIREGHAALLAPVDDAAAVTQARALGVPDLFGQEIVPPDYAMIGSIDFRHPLFEPFADARFSDFTKIHFWKYRRMAPEVFDQARVVARLDEGDPLLVEATMDQGRVWSLASGWHPDDSQLAVSSKFVPLLFRILELAGGVPATVEPKRIGDELDIPGGVGASVEGMRVVRPDGSEWVRSPEDSASLIADQPGLYQIITAQYSSPVAVNLEPAESRTGPLESDQLIGLGVPLAASKEKVAVEERRRAQLSLTELEKRQRLWRWFLLGTLTIVVFETWLGGRRARFAGKVEA